MRKTLSGNTDEVLDIVDVINSDSHANHSHTLCNKKCICFPECHIAQNERAQQHRQIWM